MLEPDGGNLYKPHPLMVHSGQFWRCAHGWTGFIEGLHWEGCPDCEKDDPEAFEAFQERSRQKEEMLRKGSKK